MAHIRIKTGDTVYVLTGKDRAMTGKVLRVIPEKEQVVVEGVNMVTKHRKPGNNYQQGEIVHMEGPIHISNVMLVDEKTKQPTKVSVKTLENGDRVRISKRSGEVIDTLSNKR